MDNWHLSKLSFEDVSKVKYIIAAFHVDDEHNDSEELNHLRDELKEVSLSITENFNDTTLKMKQVVSAIVDNSNQNN